MIRTTVVLAALAVLAGCASGNTVSRPPSAQQQAIASCSARDLVAYKAPGTRGWVCITQENSRRLLNGYAN